MTTKYQESGRNRNRHLNHTSLDFSGQTSYEHTNRSSCHANLMASTQTTGRNSISQFKSEDKTHRDPFRNTSRGKLSKNIL